MGPGPNVTSNGSRYSTLRSTPYNAEARETPYLAGSGPAECSSSTELSVLPGVIFDVNCYYRELGVPVTATRKQLREAYQAKDGQSSARLTYIFRQLLQPEVRFAYDCTPLGELFMDEYVRAAINRIVQKRQAERMADLARAGVDLGQVDEESIQRDIYAEMGFLADFSPHTDTPDEMVDGALAEEQDGAQPAKFDYSYYLWRTRPRWGSDPSGQLGSWQHLLVRALAAQGVRMKFSVGLHGGSAHRWVQAKVGYRTVFFLNIEVTPDEALAADVARQVALDRESSTAASLATTSQR